MRIISGIAKGRRLASPSTSRIRPVLDQVKESIFNILFDVTDLIVLDLFAGTGSIGLEAVSRGAAEASFVDNSKEALDIIRENIKRCRFENQCRVIPRHIDGAIKTLSKEDKKFDLIFVDPPYLKDLVVPTIRKVLETGLLAENGLIVTEHHPKEPVENLPEGLEVTDERKYGQTMITFIKLLDHPSTGSG